MQIDTILYQLLLQHECVIIPGFGGFIVRESPCNFNTGKDILKPYGKSVFFNPHLNENDGLLINAIVNTNGMSYTDAGIALEKWVEIQNNNVAEIGKSVISPIGVFYKGNDNGKWFTADSQLNLALSTYGLRPVKAGIVNSDMLVVEEQQIEFKPLADNKPIESLEVPKTSWKAWAAAAAIALVAHIGYLTFETKENPVHAASVVPASISTDNIKPAETVTEETPSETITPEETNTAEQATVITPEEVPANNETIVESKPEEKVAEVIVPQQEVPIVNETPAPVAENTEKIIGKYKLEQNAIFHQKDLAKAGITATIRKNDHNLYEVIISTSASN